MTRWTLVCDLDNAYASMEAVLNPQYRHQVLVVTGSNGGNVIARSKQAKLLGIPMGQPRHLIEPLVKAKLVTVVSASWSTYHELSQRFMQLVQSSFDQPCEVYSVDELFATITMSAAEVMQLAHGLHHKVWRQLGLSVSIGIAPNKLLAKLAVEEAKHDPSHIALLDDQTIPPLLESTLVEDLWGIGAARAERLAQVGILLAMQLRDAPISQVRGVLGVVGTRIQAELHGQIALPLAPLRVSPQQIACCRAFGKKLTTLEELRQPVIMYATRITEKLRSSQQCCQVVQVSLATNPFQTNAAQYTKGVTLTLDRPTDDTRHVIAAALAGLAQIWKKGFAYHRVGVTVCDLKPAQPEQGRLFLPAWRSERDQRLWRTVDAINTRWGRETVRLLGSGFVRTWANRNENASPRYLTQWNELPKVVVR